MKPPKLQIKKKVKIKGVTKLKREMDDIVHDALMDIKPVIVKDIMNHLKKKDIIYVQKKK